MFYCIHGVRALIYHNRKLLILKRAEGDKDDAGLWDIPGGKIEAGENIFEAVKREIFEETGVKNSAFNINNLYGLIFEKYNITKKLSVAIFICESSTSKILLNPEHSEYCWINPRELSSYKLGRVLRILNPVLQI